MSSQNQWVVPGLVSPPTRKATSWNELLVSAYRSRVPVKGFPFHHSGSWSLVGWNLHLLALHLINDNRTCWLYETQIVNGNASSQFATAEDKIRLTSFIGVSGSGFPHACRKVQRSSPSQTMRNPVPVFGPLGKSTSSSRQNEWTNDWLMFIEMIA